MHTWKTGEFARILGKEGEPEYVTIDKVSEDKVEATSHNTWESAPYDPASLEFVPPVLVSKEDLKKLVRLETTFDAVSQGAVPFDNVRGAEPIQITLEDVQTAIRNYLASQLTVVQLGDEWYWPLWDLLYMDIGLDNARNDPKEAFRAPEEFYTEYLAFSGAMADVGALVQGNELDLHDTLADIDLYYASVGKDPMDCQYPFWVKRGFLRTWLLKPEKKAMATDFVKAMVQRFLDELLADQDSFALELVKHMAAAQKKAAEEAQQNS